MRELKAAGEKLGFDVSQVLSWRIVDGVLSAVVDRGIKGCPKYTINLAELEEAEAEPEQEAEAQEKTNPVSTTRKRRTK